MLLFQGRVVGCMHSTRLRPDTRPTEQSLLRMLDDLDTTETAIELYDVAENLISGVVQTLLYVQILVA